MFNVALSITTFSMSLGDVNVFCSIKYHILMDRANVFIKNYSCRLMFFIPSFLSLFVFLLCNSRMFITKDLSHKKI